MGRLTAFLSTLAFAAAIGLALGAPAAGGGWAITTLDQLPPTFVAGQTYRLGYTIRQHGVTPIRVDRTQIIAVRGSGAPLSFDGIPDGALGHYVAVVVFPEGSYLWRVTQQPFQAQELGVLVVSGGVAARPAPDAPVPPPAPLQPAAVALAAATFAATVLFALELARQTARRGPIGAR